MHKYIELQVWPDGAPNNNGITGEEENPVSGCIANISTATLLVYPAPDPNGKAIIMCPGGGLTKISISHEGHEMAEWFTSRGITFAILKYRLPNGHGDILLSDILQSLRILSDNKQKWNIRKIGVMGASIGGYIASSAAVFFTPDTRPDFQILLYPVISMDKCITHLNSRKQILGDAPSEEIVRAYSTDLHVTEETPPAFITAASDDPVVSPENSICYYDALLWNKIPASMHIYPTGGHGFGFKDTFPYKQELLCELGKWLSNIE